jgi:hypothetical protein
MLRVNPLRERRTQAGKMMSIFRQLRWQLTLSYTLVTVGAFLVIVLILEGILFTQIFAPENAFTVQGLVEIIQKNTVPYWSPILEKDPVDTEVISILIRNATNQITSRTFLRMGALRFSVQTAALIRILIIGADGTLLGTSDPSFLPSIKIGQPFDISRIPGLQEPFEAALAV